MAKKRRARLAGKKIGNSFKWRLTLRPLEEAAKTFRVDREKGRKARNQTKAATYVEARAEGEQVKQR
jgi:hypothetical protein